MAPAAVVAVLFTVTIWAWAAQRVTPSDPRFLEPRSAAAIGARTVASGHRVRRVGSTARALTDATPGATLFVPAPAFARPALLREALDSAELARVVLVAPPPTVLTEQHLPARRVGTRWATGVADPGCAGAPGPAALRGATYAGTKPGARRCYDGGLLTLPATAGKPRVVLVGAADVFRNDRAGEYRNAAVAGALLGGRPVLWLSLHRPEPVPALTSSGDPDSPSPTPQRDTGGSAPPAGQQHGGTGSSDRAGGGSGTGNGSGSGGGTPNPLWSAFPPWVFAIAAQLAIAAVLFMAWRARRLGGPVSEPLPVLVPGTETVLGRARLYRRAGATGAAAAALRAGTVRRLRTGYGGLDGAALVGAVAATTGWPYERVESVLYGPAPERNDELRALATDLDELRLRAFGQPAGAAEEGTRRAEQR